MQLKIKIALAPEVSEPSLPPYDLVKIVRFSLFIISIICAIVYFFWSGKTSPEIQPIVHIANEPAATKDKLIPSASAVSDNLATAAVKVNMVSTTQVKPLPSITVVERAKSNTAASEQMDMAASPSQAKVEKVAKKAQTDSAASHVMRALLTSAVVTKEPVDNLTQLVSLSKHRKLYFYTHLVDLKGIAVTHHWYHNDVLVADVTLAIGSDNWRTYSSKSFSAKMTGKWRVELVKKPDIILSSINFDIGH